MDFFILLSSIVGIAGNRGQANYACGNTYQDALARYRVACEEKGTSLNLGVISSVGFAAQRQNITDSLVSQGFMVMSETEIHAILDHLCDPATDPSLSQVITGIEMPDTLRSKGIAEPFWLRKPLFRTILEKNAAYDNSAQKSECMKI